MGVAQHYVFACMECNKPILIKVEFMQFGDEKCLDFKNHKLLRVFNDEREAKNYFDIYLQSLKNEKKNTKKS